MKPITDYELIDHGIDHEQYFPGCGVALTEYTDCATGIGENPAEAIEDALETLAQDGWDTEHMLDRIKADYPEAHEPDAFEAAEVVVDEQHYYVSIRVRGGI